jgi:general secretion pathway protein I
MRVRCEQGFTLIEVIVAFAIFALSIGAIFAVFRQAVHTSEQVRERDLAWLTAESVLSKLSVERAPWPSEQRGASSHLRWKADVQPYPVAVGRRSSWVAYRVEVHVAPLNAAGPIITLDSVELARSKQ